VLGLDLDEASALLMAALSRIEQSVCVSDVTLPDQPLVWVNDAFVRTTGYSREEALGRNCRFLQDLEDEGVTEAAAQMRHALESASGVTLVVRNRRKDGTLFFNEVSLSPLVTSRGGVEHVVAVQRDVTARLEAEAARTQARAELAELGTHLQRQLAPPQLPGVPGYELTVCHHPGARPDGTQAEVSGDFYDVVASPTAHVVTIGDVSGRGPQAAAATSTLRWALRGVTQATSEPDLLLARTAEVVADALGDRFATVAAVRLAAHGQVSLSLAGHPRAMLVGPDGVRAVGDPGMLLGPFLPLEVTATSLELAVGESLVLYTDGVTEAMSPSRALFEEEGLVRALAAVPRARPQALLERVLEAVREHVAGGPVDDLTVLALQRTA
jgi:PAS domain S-box-containing protein